MNRISTWEEPKLTQQAIQATLKADLAASSTNKSTAYATFVPLHYEQNYAYPLLVWLHSTGDDESQLRRVMPLVSLRNYLAVSPRAANSEEQTGGVSYGWCQSSTGIAAAEQRVLHCIDLTLVKYHVNATRIFLAGCGEGGTMALRIGLAHPDKFAGVASFGGAFPTSRAPLRNLKSARRVNVLVAQGRNSVCYDESEFCNDLRLLHYAGMCTTFRQYPDADALTSKMLRDLDVWMMEVVTECKSSAEESSTLWLDEL